MKVAIALLPQTVPASAANLLDVLHSANRRAGRAVFRTVVVADDPAPVGHHGVCLQPQAGLDALARADWLLVPAVRGELDEVLASSVALRRRLARWLRGERRLASACTGALVLAGAGVLDGRWATTHWAAAAEAARRFPAVRWRFEGLVESDGQVLTSGGGSAGIDLALHLIEQALGAELARQVAAGLLFDHRRGPQSHYFPLAPAAQRSDALVTAASQRLRESLPQALDVRSLAAALHTTPRTLLRRFKADTGLTLQTYAQRLRLEAARALLERQASVDEAVAAVGYSDRASFSRAFKAHYGVPPVAFKLKRVAKAAAAEPSAEPTR